MKLKQLGLLACTAALSILATASPAYARRRGVPISVFVSWGGERIIQVADFPDTDDLKTADGRYVDPGYRYKQIKIFLIPVWNYGGQWCGYIGSTEQYLDIDKEMLDALADSVDMQLPDTPRFSFWETYGGKLLLLSLFGLPFAIHALKRKPSELPQSTMQPEHPVSTRPPMPTQMDASKLPRTPARPNPPSPPPSTTDHQQSPTDESQR
jgi:hypothetical protein